MKTVTRLAIALFVLIVAGTLAPSVATAAVAPNPPPPNKATNGTAVNLPGGYDGGSKCNVRRIQLYSYAKGYTWQQYGDNSILYTRSIKLTGGTYTWTVCVHSGNWGNGDNWAQASSLALAGHPTARLPNFYFYGDDTPNEYYLFGDYLTPIT